MSAEGSRYAPQARDPEGQELRFTVRPRPQVSFRTQLGSNPKSFSYRLRLGGEELAPVILSPPRRAGAVLRQGLSIPAESLSSGMVSYQDVGAFREI